MSSPLAENERHARYAALKEALTDYIGADVEVDNFIDAVTIYHASAFSLNLDTDIDNFDFDPVLFGRDITDNSVDCPISEATSALLPPKLQTVFAKTRFRQFGDARSAYPLQKGSFVIIDPVLQKPLQEVFRVSNSDAGTKREFVSNPTGFLRSVLGDSVEIPFDEVFIETEEFSNRITGIDIWRKQVLPYLKLQPNSWIPETFGLRVGEDEFLEVNPQELPDIQREIDNAIKSGDPIVQVRDTEIPASEQTIQAIKDLSDLQEAIVSHTPGSNSQDDSSAPPEILANKRFLTVKSNFEDINFGLIDKTTISDISIPVAQPTGLNTSLMDHQLSGYKWLVESYSCKYPGVLLADDMGLGKTLQTLSFLVFLKEQNSGPTLIVAPTGLLANWKAEIDRHLQPNLLGKLVYAFGKNLQNYRLYSSNANDTKIGRSSLDIEEWKNAGAIFTTYETMRDYHISFARIRFSSIVFDEIQKLKNPTSQMSRSAQTLNADFKVGLTGTPIENHLLDIWAIMDVIWPGYLGSSKEFIASYSGDNAQKLNELHSKIFGRSEDRPSSGLRRLKADYLEGLPEKEEHSLEVDMPPAQAAAYQSVISRAFAMRTALTPGDGMLRTLHDLRNTSLHHRDPGSGYGDMDSYVQESARLKKTIELLDEIRVRQEKVLIFIESLDMQVFMVDFIQQRYKLLSTPKRIYGQVPGVKRQEIVNWFQNECAGFNVLILSPKAGGVGLTLTSANHVIHLSRWWNPAVEDQSTDRVFRIGQTRKVEVYYPMAVHPSTALRSHSFDLKLNALLAQKRQLSSNTLVPPENVSSDAASLFSDVTVNPEAQYSDVPKNSNQSVTVEGSTVVDVKHSMSSVQETTSISPEVLAVGSQSTGRPSRFHYSENCPPDYNELFWDLDDAEVREMILLDPYCFWRKKGQRGLANIVVGLAEKAKEIGVVHVEMLPPRKVDGREFETEQDGLYHFKSLINDRFHKINKRMPRVLAKTRTKSSGRDFHDRFISVTKTENGTHTKRSYLVARGLDAFEDYRMDLRVFIDEELQV